MAEDDSLPIRSYRLCFDLERRIHKIDRWRIPVPYGVPLRGIAYALVALALVLVASGLPVLGVLLSVVHPAIRLVVLPAGVGYLLCQLRVDGRPAHAASIAWLRHRLRSRRLTAFRPAEAAGPARFEDVVMAPDEGSSSYRPAVVQGPASLLLRYPARARRRCGTLELRQRAARPMWRGKRLRVDERQRVKLR